MRLATGRTLLTLALLVAAHAEPQSSAPKSAKEKHPAMQHATGKFTVRMLPPQPPVPGSFVRLELEKQFEGGLAGSSKVEMLASNGGNQPAGGYVALERFTGTVNGKEGSFIMQHSGTMTPGSTSIQVLVTPGSGTGAVIGIAGKLNIRIEGKEHFYDLEYTLPE